jgi:hypothetical protein
MRLVVDTRTQGTYVFALECATCNNTNRYEKHPNATVVPGLPSKHIRDIDLIAGYTTNDTVCIIDNEGVGQVNYPCSDNRTIAVITEQKGIYHENVDGIIGLGRIPFISAGDQHNQTQFLAGLVNETRKDGINKF